MFTPWGPSAVPTGGAGFAAPAGSWSLSVVLIGFAIMIVLILKFLHLDRVELDGRLAAGHAHHDLDIALLEIDLLHLAIVILEGTVDDLYRFAYPEVNFEFRLLLAHAHHEIVDLFLRERRRRSAVRAHEAGHARRIPHHVPGIFREDHVDKHIPRIDLFLYHGPLAVLHADLLFLGNGNAEYLIVHGERIHALFQIARHRVFVAGIGMNGIPMPLAYLLHCAFHHSGGHGRKKVYMKNRVMPIVKR